MLRKMRKKRVFMSKNQAVQRIFYFSFFCTSADKSGEVTHMVYRLVALRGQGERSG